MKKRFETVMQSDTLLAGWAMLWLERCDYVLGRRDEWMALCWIVERVLLLLAGLWWLWVHIPVMVGFIFNGLTLLPIVLMARRRVM